MFRRKKLQRNNNPLEIPEIKNLREETEKGAIFHHKCELMDQLEEIIANVRHAAKSGRYYDWEMFIFPENEERLKAAGYKIEFDEDRDEFKISWEDDYLRLP